MLFLHPRMVCVDRESEAYVVTHVRELSHYWRISYYVESWQWRSALDGTQKIYHVCNTTLVFTKKRQTLLRLPYWSNRLAGAR